MAFIETVGEDDASGGVEEMYTGYRERLGYLPNYARVFSHRPEVMAAWGQLLGSIRQHMDTRRYELVTLAAARALKSSYCMLAHGKILRDQFFTSDQLTTIARAGEEGALTPAEVAMMAYAEQIVRDATAVTQAHIDALRAHGFTDPEIFDIAATATARCFFSKTLDALGAEPDEAYLALEDELRQTLTVGRAIEGG